MSEDNWDKVRVQESTFLHHIRQKIQKQEFKLERHSHDLSTALTTCTLSIESFFGKFSSSGKESNFHEGGSLPPEERLEASDEPPHVFQPQKLRLRLIHMRQ